jgi:hypothetical protein
LWGLSQTLEMAAKVVGSDRTFRGEPSLKTVPIRPFLGLLTNFATGPFCASLCRRYLAISPDALAHRTGFQMRLSAQFTQMPASASRRLSALLRLAPCDLVIRFRDRLAE